MEGFVYVINKDLSEDILARRARVLRPNKKEGINSTNKLPSTGWTSTNVGSSANLNGLADLRASMTSDSGR
jgi:hypothetical protein